MIPKGGDSKPVAREVGLSQPVTKNGLTFCKHRTQADRRLVFLRRKEKVEVTIEVGPPPAKLDTLDKVKGLTQKSGALELRGVTTLGNKAWRVRGRGDTGYAVIVTRSDGKTSLIAAVR